MQSCQLQGCTSWIFFGAMTDGVTLTASDISKIHNCDQKLSTDQVVMHSTAVFSNRRCPVPGQIGARLPPPESTARTPQHVAPSRVAAGMHHTPSNQRTGRCASCNSCASHWATARAWYAEDCHTACAPGAAACRACLLTAAPGAGVQLDGVGLPPMLTEDSHVARTCALFHLRAPSGMEG